MAERFSPSVNGSTKGKSLWARQPNAPQERVTQRLRKMVEGLPDWEPMPPGEIVVRRPRQS